MRIDKFRNVILVAGLFFFITMLFIYARRPVRAVTLSPPVMEIEADVGETIRARINLVNDEQDLCLYYLSTADFEPEGEYGQASFLFPGQSSRSLSSWIELPSAQVILGSGERAEVNFDIKIPDRAEPGGYYGAVFFSDIPPDYGVSESSIVSASSRLASLILLRVDGEVIEQGEIDYFSTREERLLFSSLPVDFVVKFENKGNVHLKPEGRINIINFLGRQVEQVAQVGIYDPSGNLVSEKSLDYLPVNYSRVNVLPNSSRQFKVGWFKNLDKIDSNGFWANLGKEFKNFKFGVFKTELEMKFGQDEQVLVEKGPTVAVLPWRIIVVVLTGMIFLGLMFLWLTRRFKSKDGDLGVG